MPTKQTIALTLAILVSVPFTEAYADQWDGLFLGVNAGAAQTNARYKTGPVNLLWAAASEVGGGMWEHGNLDRSSFSPIGGLSAAYNVQVDSFVFGGEVGLNAINLRLEDTNNYLYTNQTHEYTYVQKTDVRGLYTLRGRAGYAFGNSLLSATAGLAATSLKTGLKYVDDYEGMGKYTGQHTDTTAKVGWTAGVAYEHMLADDMALKAEFAYVDLGKASFTTPIWAGDGSYEGKMAFSSRVRMNVFTVGFEKKF